ncbi:MAG: DUF3078 domain-containing protein [Tannerella sp.]|nr:DUF3078 domain-containing protein [Tannerella sp.]
MKNYINNHYKFCALLFAFILHFITNVNAQSPKTYGLPPEVMAWTISTMEPWPPHRYKSLKEAMIDNKVFIPLVFSGGMFPEFDYKYSRDSLKITDTPPIPSAFEYKSKRIRPMFRYYTLEKMLSDLVYKNVMLKDPGKFKYSLRQLPETVIKPESIDKSTDYVVINVKAPTTIPPEKVDPVIKFIPDRKYWTSSFSADIKFSQNKTSANWYKGEINNMNIYTNTNTSYNYRRDKISLTNTLSTTFTINNAPNDTLRDYTIGSDELRFRSNFGLTAIRNWNYSSSAEFITSMGNKYVANSKVKNSAFLSPYTINAGIGMTYAVKPKFKKKDRSMNLSLSLEPFSFKYMYARNKKINLSPYFEKDENGNYKHVLRTFGSTITMTNTIQFIKNISLYSRLYYFTNYERVIGEFENKLDLALNKYFSTTFYLYLRYDDGVVKKEGSDTYLQVNEMFSFGFSYRW